MYCLRCLEKIERDEKACPACGYRSNKVERRIYWNRRPGLIALENVLKTLAVLICVALFFFVAVNLRGPRTAGYIMAAPVLLGVMLWLTIGKLTRHEVYFRPVVFWIALFALGGVYCLIDGKTLAASAALVLCALVNLLGKLGERWKDRLRFGPPTPS